MPVVRAILDELELPLVSPFETSFGVERSRRFLLVRLEDDQGHEGYGECVAAREPGYSSETVATARWAMEELLFPRVFRGGDAPAAFRRSAGRIRGHAMARAAVEMALWDLEGQRRRRSLADLLGGSRSVVEVGVSVGIQRTSGHLVATVAGYLGEGYRRVKLKVRPGWDQVPLRAVRKAFPDVRLWVDANQAYPTRAVGAIRAWARRFEVEQVEQPFPERAIDAHAQLQRGSPFLVCLDESIVDRPSFEDAVGRAALRSLNVKAGRLGGLTEARDLARAAKREGIHAWVGGMLESGVGRAANLALATSSAFDFPGDISASARYFSRDIIQQPFVLGPGGTLRAPRGPGLGVEVEPRAYRSALVRRTVRRR